jgi:hypothetical protein
MARLSTAANRWRRVATKPVGLEELERVLQPASLRKLPGRAEAIEMSICC